MLSIYSLMKPARINKSSKWSSLDHFFLFLPPNHSSNTSKREFSYNPDFSWQRAQPSSFHSQTPLNWMIYEKNWVFSVLECFVARNLLSVSPHIFFTLFLLFFHLFPHPPSITLLYRHIRTGSFAWVQSNQTLFGKKKKKQIKLFWDHLPDLGSSSLTPEPRVLVLDAGD